MNPWLRIAVVLCAGALSAAAQNQPPIEATAAANPNGGGATITVRNHYSSPLVAFVFIYTLRDAQATVYSASNGYYDSAIEPQQRAIPPNEEIRIPYYAGNRALVPVINVAGALFADGFTVGQHDMVQTIFERRNYALVTLKRCIGDLKQAAANGSTRDQLMGNFQMAMNEERMAAGTGNNDMSMVILTIRNQVFIDLANARNPDGTPMALDKFIPAEIEGLNRRRDALAPPKP